VILLQSALNAREKALIEFNGTPQLLSPCARAYCGCARPDTPALTLLPRTVVDKTSLESVIAGLPSMKRPTISTLYGDDGFAVRSVIPRKAVVSLVPWIKANGGSDVIVTEIKQVIV
jgi:ATP phosphoribosyltransferase-like protein